MIRRDDIAECPLISILGEVDFSNIANLKSELESLAAQPVVVVSLEHATFVDSSVLAALVRQHHKRAGALVVILPPANRLTRIFQISGLHAVLTIVPDLLRARELVAAKRGVGGALFPRDGVVANMHFTDRTSR